MKASLTTTPGRFSVLCVLFPIAVALNGPPWPVTLLAAAYSGLVFRGYTRLLAKAEKAQQEREAQTHRTIDDLKQEVRCLAQTNVRYESLMATTNDAVILVDSEGRIVEANANIAALLSYDQAELAGHFLPDMASVTQRRQLVSLIADAVRDGVAASEGLTLNRLDGESQWFDMRAVRIDMDEKTIVQLVLRDISERRRQFILTEKEISFLHELSRTLPLLQDFDQMLDKILDMLSEALSFHGFALVLAEPNETIATICVGNKTKAAFLKNLKSRVADILPELADGIDTKKVEYIIERKAAIERAENDTVGSQIMLPLAIVNGVAGLFSSRPNAFKKEDLSLFSTMVSGISSLYIAYRSYQQVQHLSVTDSLTGLYNRRKFFEELDREVERSSRYQSELSLIMLDIDHFKNINDRYGHQMGDEVLRALAEVLRAGTRKTDIIARYGGEEFIILLPETPLSGAQGVADRIRRKTEEAVVLGAAIELKFTVSIGLAGFQEQDTVDSLVGRADKALYAAKKNGRNRVESLIS